MWLCSLIPIIVTTSVMQFVVLDVVGISSGSLYISGVFNLAIKSARILLLPLMLMSRLFSDNSFDQWLSLGIFIHNTKMTLKVYDHNEVCTLLLISINWTSGKTGKLQKLLLCCRLFLLQVVKIIWGINYWCQIIRTIDHLSENARKSITSVNRVYGLLMFGYSMIGV